MELKAELEQYSREREVPDPPTTLKYLLDEPDVVFFEYQTFQTALQMLRQDPEQSSVVLPVIAEKYCNIRGSDQARVFSQMINWHYSVVCDATNSGVVAENSLQVLLRLCDVDPILRADLAEFVCTFMVEKYKLACYRRRREAELKLKLFFMAADDFIKILEKLNQEVDTCVYKRGSLANARNQFNKVFLQCEEVKPKVRAIEWNLIGC